MPTISRPRCKQKRHTLSMSPPFPRKQPGLRDVNVRGKFDLRQGLWIEDLRIPPGQECSNGSLILLAVVLWRTFFDEARPGGCEVEGGAP
jgi:hypothetical protein